MREVAYHGRGFTLIELLVVIAIIAILAAILFPVFASVRASGKRAKCVSNLKNIGTAINMYADDYNGFIYPRIYSEQWGRWHPGCGFENPCDDLCAAYWRYAKSSALIWRCPFDGANNQPTGERFRAGSNGYPSRMSYLYVGLDIWKTGWPKRNITDKERYQGPNGTQGWLARDKDWVRSQDGFLATVHAVGTRTGTDFIWGVSSNVLLFDGSVAWRRDWDG